MRVLVLVAVLAACKGKDKPEARAGDDTPAPAAVRIDWARCEQAIARATTAPLAARPQLVLDGCQVCGGDWKPLLAWNVEASNGGPRREQIERMMVACDAFCTGDSKLKFMAGVDKARGRSVNTPWRQLATACGDKVNGSADPRFMSAPFFALDRIARAAASKGGAIADKLAALELPLPAITISGAGVALPESDAVTPNAGALHVTVLGDAIHVGTLPHAKLGASGVLAKLGNAGYPGDAVELEKLGETLRELTGGDTTQTITILAPHAMPAVKLVPIIAAASAVAPVYLGAHAHESPEGWQLPGAIPVALQVGKDLVITDETTVQNLARELTAVAARKQQHIGVTKQ